MKYVIVFTLSFLLLSLSRCFQSKIVYTDYLGEITYPVDNQFDSAKVKLGEKLFFDKRLSIDNSISCASCHVPSLAFTDGKKKSVGFQGQETQRNSPTLLNVAYNPTLMFDGEIKTLEMQAIVPIQEHTEMAIPMKDLINKLKQIPEYQNAAKALFNSDFTPFVLTRSIAAFERTLLAENTAFDKYYYGKQKKAISKKAIKGWEIFSKQLYCTSCHPPPYFTTFKVENNGFYKLKDIDLGRFRIHGDSNDIGKFKVPTLRNITLTGPYMHNGELGSLEDVINYYSAGGSKNKGQDIRIQAFSTSKEQKDYLIEFFKSLNANSYLKD